jgi:hypothetical protein
VKCAVEKLTPLLFFWAHNFNFTFN